LKEIDHLGNLGIDGRVNKWGGRAHLESYSSGQVKLVDYFEHSHEPSGFIRCGEVLD